MPIWGLLIETKALIYLIQAWGNLISCSLHMKRLNQKENTESIIYFYFDLFTNVVPVKINGIIFVSVSHLCTLLRTSVASVLCMEPM